MNAEINAINNSIDNLDKRLSEQKIIMNVQIERINKLEYNQEIILDLLKTIKSKLTNVV